MASPTEATGSGTSVLPPAIPPARRAGAGPVEPFLPPPAGRAAFRQRFTGLGAGAVEVGSETIPISEEMARPYRAEGEAEGRTPHVADPDLAHLAGLLSDLVEDLQERGEAALEIRDGLPTFQVTLRAYCRGYMDGRRGAREG